MLIPRIFHQIWVGADPFPEEFVAYRQSWIDRHPEWELRLWTEENVPSDARRPEVYELLRQPAERSDILRFELLWRFGGVYVDCDFECLRSIDPLLEEVTFFAGYRKPARANNALIGAVPGHPLVDRALTEIRPRTTYGPVDKDGTGPVFFNRVLADFPEATIFEQNVFYPRTPNGRQKAYAVHHRARFPSPAKSPIPGRREAARSRIARLPCRRSDRRPRRNRGHLRPHPPFQR